MQAPIEAIKGFLYVGKAVHVFDGVGVQVFRSIQNLKLPSFLRTRTTALAHGLHERRMALILSMSCRWFLTSSNCCGVSFDTDP